MKKKIIPIVICMISSVIITVGFTSELTYKSVTQDSLIEMSDYIAIVEKTGIAPSSEKISIGLFNPPFIKRIAHYRVIETLYTAPDIKTAQNGIIKVVMANCLENLSVQKSYYRDKISGSYMFDRYRNSSVDSVKDTQFIIYAKQHFTVKGFFSEEIVPVEGMIEWTVENSYDLTGDKERVINILKSKNKIK